MMDEMSLNLSFLILVLTLRISIVSIGSRQSRANFSERLASTCKKSRTGNCNVPLVIGSGPQLSSLLLYVFYLSFFFFFQIPIILNNYLFVTSDKSLQKDMDQVQQGRFDLHRAQITDIQDYK